LSLRPLCLPCGLFPQGLHWRKPRRRRRLRTLGKDSLDSSLRNTFGTQHVVERDQLARKSTGGQVLGEGAEHAGALDRLLLDRGDPVPAARKLCSKHASPLAPTGAAIKVLRRPKPRLSATLHGRISRYIGTHLHPIWPLVFGPELQLKSAVFLPQIAGRRK
jgi:hypothetical protein